MKHQIGYAIFNEEKENFLNMDPGIGPMSAPGYAYEANTPSYGIWVEKDKAQKWLDIWKEYTSSYKVVPLFVET